MVGLFFYACFFGAVNCIVIAGLSSGFSLIVLASLWAIRYNPAAAKQCEKESESGVRLYLFT